MACYKPLTAWQRTDGTVIFAERGDIQRQLQLACGQCTGCRLEKSRQWAMRCLHEAKTHAHNSFLTLTYQPEHLPPRGQLVKSHAVNFLKRLRERVTRKPHDFYADKPTVRFYLAGEYGERTKRPHFHICIFGIDFREKIYLSKSPAGSKLYRAPVLEQLWTYGYSSVGTVNFESAAYTARYIMKKITGAQQKKHYERIDENGEIYTLQPEYNNMSRRPGIGKAFFDQYHKDFYPEGKCVIRGKRVNTPRFYDKQYAIIEPLKHEDLIYGRHIEGILHAQDQTPERQAVKEAVTQARIKQLQRKL